MSTAILRSIFNSTETLCKKRKPHAFVGLFNFISSHGALKWNYCRVLYSPGNLRMPAQTDKAKGAVV